MKKVKMHFVNVDHVTKLFILHSACETIDSMVKLILIHNLICVSQGAL